MHIIILYISLFFIKNIAQQNDIFELTKNLKFCGADLLSQQNLNISSNINKINHRKRSLVITQFKPIRIFVETSYFEYQGSLNPELNKAIPILKSALNESVEVIKNLIQVEDKGDTNLFEFINSDYFLRLNIIKWNPIFDRKENINYDFLILVKFDSLPGRVIAAAVPDILDNETSRPLTGILTLSNNTSFYSARRVKEYFRLIILHELTHALGFLYQMFYIFPGGINNTVGLEYIRGAIRYVIKTPKVLEMAKKYFNCSNIKGVELEDQGGEGTAFSHWEQRILLGDYMGGIIYQEEMAISEITLALLEDSSWYKVNYYTGGLMRFGKNKGCKFLESNCLDSNYNTEFDNEFFDLNEAFRPSCSAGRQSRTYSFLVSYFPNDPNYGYNFVYNQNTGQYLSGSMKTTDYCFTHGQSPDESRYEYFTGHCKYGSGVYGNSIYYFNQDTQQYELNHPNSEFSEELGEIYSDTSFCIMSSLTPKNKYKLFNSITHPMCYQMHCSSTTLTIQIFNDFVICPKEGGNIMVIGYDGYIHCPDYNLICAGTEVCNDIFDCIEKKSLIKESSFYYDYIPVTTQRFSQIPSIPLMENYELSDDGFCPKNCAQCDINKKCKKCQEGYNLIGKKFGDNETIICDNKIDINNENYYLLENTYYLCNDECDKCQSASNLCINCAKNYYPLEDKNYCFQKDVKIEEYYFNENLNLFSSCYKNCKTCSKEPISDQEMNCDSCKDEYTYDNNKKNCEIKNTSKVAWIVFAVIFFILIVGLGFLFYFFFKHYKGKKQNKEIQATTKLEI